MDLNQIQNPNMPLPGTGPAMPQMPVAQKKSYLLWIVIALIVAAGVAAWWYIGQMTVQPLGLQQSPVNHEAREDASIGRDIQGTDMGDLDAEFRSTIDSDLNSL